MVFWKTNSLLYYLNKVNHIYHTMSGNRPPLRNGANNRQAWQTCHDAIRPNFVSGIVRDVQIMQDVKSTLLEHYIIPPHFFLGVDLDAIFYASKSTNDAKDPAAPHSTPSDAMSKTQKWSLHAGTLLFQRKSLMFHTVNYRNAWTDRCGGWNMVP